MMTVYYFLIAYSISFLFVYSIGPFKIFDKIREYADKMPSNIGELFDCMYCFPSWVGLGLSLINQFLIPYICFTPFYTLFGGICPWYIILILDMFVTNATIYIMDAIIKRILNEV